MHVKNNTDRMLTIVLRWYFFISVFMILSLFFFFQAEDGIRDRNVTGVQTCALPIFLLAIAILSVVLLTAVKPRRGKKDDRQDRDRKEDEDRSAHSRRVSGTSRRA